MTTQYRVAELSTFPWQDQVISRLDTQPASPTEGQRYLVIATASGAQWTGQEGKIAWCSVAGTPGTWSFIDPAEGMTIYSLADHAAYRYDNNSAWVALTEHTQNTDTGTTSASFQIDSGNTGPKLVNDSGTMKITESDGSTLTPVEVLSVTDGSNSSTPEEIKTAYDTRAVYNAALKCLTFTI
jgi:hypothetical protein